jgi:hypothetical protein
MTRISWGGVGDRVFQAGVDRGMLYINTDVAVPWNGLSSVTEAPTGADPQDYYLDGRKIQSIAASEEFGATIDAFSSPIEFAPCAGRLNLSPALYVADQPRAKFGFSYRTMIGNDVNSTDLAYKVHLVYNAVAQISDFTHTTDSDSAAPIVYSFTVTTLPEEIDEFKPTSHFVVDSRKIDPTILSQLEAILYGDDDNDPRFPSAQEFATLTS